MASHHTAAAVASFKPATASLSRSMDLPTTADRQQMTHAVNRATAMLGFYRKDDAWDPEMFLTGIAAVLALYPTDIIDQVTNPALGLPSKLRFPPTPAEVKDACEVLMAPIRAQQERERKVQLALADRRLDQQLDEQRSKRRTYNEIAKDFAKVGIHLGGQPRPIETVDAVRQRLGCSQEQWDAIPNAPPRT